MIRCESSGRLMFLPLLALLVTILNSCKKDEVQESYLRGGNSIIAAADGNLIIAGYNFSESTSFDGLLTSIDPQGNIRWSKSYGSNGSDGFYDLVPAHDGGFVTVGFTTSGYNSSLIILKVNESGEEQWRVSGKSEWITKGFSIASCNDSGYIACGYLMESSGADHDIYLIRISDNGAILWEKKYGTKTSTSADNDEAYRIIPVEDGFFITGSLAGQTGSYGNIFLMKLNDTGDSLWSKAYSAGLGYSIIQAIDDGLIIGGMLDTNGKDAVLVKVNDSGDKIWEKSIGSNGYDLGATVITTPDGAYAFCGVITESGSSDQDVALHKISATGDLIWTRTYGGSDIDQGFGLAVHPGSGFCITGMSNSGGSYVFLNHTDPEGTEVWQKNYR